MPDDPQAPSFRQWAQNPENADELDALIAHFLANDGVEMMAELATSDIRIKPIVEEYLGKLRDRFETWWDEGRPRLGSASGVKITYSVPASEREAHEYLDANLPPGATYSVARRMRRVPTTATGEGKSQMVDWYCRIEDGPATSGGCGYTALKAAQQALAAWRDFVTGTRVEIEGLESKPPPLQVPSGLADEGRAEEKRVS
jgi:hypothetical protein